MSTDLGVDGGQSGLRIGIVRPDASLEVIERPGFAYRPAADGVGADAAALVDALRAVDARPRRIALGLTNAPARAAERIRLAEAVRDAVGAEAVLVTSDMVSAHAGALGGADGVVVAAGTGAVCFGRSGTDCVRSDGFGYLVGDECSGFAVGRAGLRAALRALEGRGPATALAPAAQRRYADVSDFPHGLYRRPRVVAEIAAFARDVASAADAGDPVARDIWSAAVDRLVDSVHSVVARCPGLAAAADVPVSYGGGLFRVEQHVRRSFAERLPRAVPTARLVAPIGDALAGAVRLLADDAAAAYGELVNRVTAVPA